MPASGKLSPLRQFLHFIVCPIYISGVYFLHTYLVVRMATIGSNQSERRKDNGEINFGSRASLAWVRHQFVHATHFDQSEHGKGITWPWTQVPEGAGQQCGRKSIKTHCIRAKNHGFCLIELRTHALVTSGTCATSWCRHVLHIIYKSSKSSTSSPIFS